MSEKIQSWLKYAWTFLDGNKTFIVAVISVIKIMCPGCYGVSYISTILHALGWDTVTAAFDPVQASIGVGVLIALGHHVVKGVQQYRKGVPIEYVQTEKGAVLAAVNTGQVHAIVAEVKDEAPKVV